MCINKGPDPAATKRLAEKLGFKNIGVAQEQMSKLYDMFIKCDCTQVEINPFVETKDGKGESAGVVFFTKSVSVYCVDAKLNFDDNAAFRQKDIFAMRDPTEEDPREVAASKFDLNYIGMDGEIGCMGMLIVKLHSLT